MIDCISYEGLIENVRSKVYNEESRRTIGILLGNPHANFVKDNIINKIEYYHERSGHEIDFYFPGYGAYWYGCYPDAEKVCTLNQVDWSFSSKKYCDFIKTLEAISKWQYSGETELIIVDYVNGRLDFSTMFVFWLDRMVADKVVFSPGSFFETIFRFFSDERSIRDVSNNLTLNKIGDDIVKLVKKGIPFGNLYDDCKYFCIRNFEKNY